MPDVGRPARSELSSPLMAQARPSPLDVAEENHPAARALARRFNPAMALPIREIWPVEVRYAWHDGADLIARTADGAEQVAVPGSALSRSDWSNLPHQSVDGRPIHYYLDGPGDDRPSGPGGPSRWRQRFRQIAQPQGPDVSPTSSPYPPTQYAHLYWWNRERALLAVQYWFYYPFNEWVNHHEGDWECVQVVLAGANRLDDTRPWRPVGYQYFFHEFWIEPTRLVRLAGRAPGDDHPLVYVGGEASFFAWGGSFSGASYPLPARYRRAGFDNRWLSPDEDTSRPVRFLAPWDFQVILLPEPERLDAARFPELSWLRLPFYAGQRQVEINPPGYRTFGRDHPPLQPAARPAWRRPPHTPPWRDAILPGAATASHAERWPRSWRCAHPEDPAACAIDG